MRARVRHFQPKDAGANLVLDARYIAQGNSTAVSSWADRSGNAYNADQATGGKQPTFETAGVGGQGAVKFDGGDVLEISGGYTNLLSADNTWSLVMVTNLSSFSAQPVVFGRSNQFFFEYGDMNTVYYYVGEQNTYRTYGTSNAAMSTNTSYVAGFTKTAATSGTLYVNGNSQASFTNSGIYNPNGLQTTPSATGDLFVGAYTSTPTFAITGYIPFVAFFKTDLSDSMRKRVEQCAARSWKISCN